MYEQIASLLSDQLFCDIYGNNYCRSRKSHGTQKYSGYMCVEVDIFNIKQGCSYNYHRQYSTDPAIIFIYASKILPPRALAYMTI